MIRLILTILLICGFGCAQATHLQNGNSGLCAKVDGTQATCAASSTQDAAFDVMSAGKYRIRFGALCLAAGGGTVGSTLTLATCSSSTSQLWTVYKRASNSPWRQYENDLGNCLGIGNSSDAAGAAMKIVACNSHSASWITDLEYVYAQKPSATTTPVFVITSGALGAKVAGVTATVGATCSCSTFSSGAYCALVATPTRAALCRPFGGRVVASNAPLTHSTRAAPSIPTPETVAARTLTASGRIDMVSGSPGSPMIYQNLKVSTNTSNNPCFAGDSIHDVIIQDSEIGPCADPSLGAGNPTPTGVQDWGIFLPNAGDNIVIRRNVIHDASTLIYMPSGGSGIQIYNNYLYNWLGPQYGAHAIQIGGGVTTGATQNKINCNVVDGRWPKAPIRTQRSEDKINVGSVYGTSSLPFEIAYNRILGARVSRGLGTNSATGDGSSGSGFQLGDVQSSASPDYLYVHDNTVTATNGGGLYVSGGTHATIANNRIDQRGENSATKTGTSFNFSNHYAGDGGVCSNLTVTGNRGATLQWYYEQPGVVQTTANNDGTCTPQTFTSNNFNDTTLAGVDEFDEEYSACD